jgi:isochorismate pyruvate lyase
MPPSEEPRADTAPVRRFRDPAYRPRAATLGELRQKIDAIDVQIVELLAARALCVRDATRFKRDAFQVSAPARQAEVFERVRRHAAAQAAEFPALPDIVEAAYRVLVAGFIAGEAHFFAETEPIAS